MADKTLTFGQLEIGDLFLVNEIKYRKIPPIELPDSGVRNAARESNQAWFYFALDKIVVRYGTSEYDLDWIRAHQG